MRVLLRQTLLRAYFFVAPAELIRQSEIGGEDGGASGDIPVAGAHDFSLACPEEIRMMRI